MTSLYTEPAHVAAGAPAAELIAKIRRLADAGRPGVVETAIAAANPLGALAVLREDAIWWSAPDGTTALGVGAIARLVSSGRGRFHEVAVAADELLAGFDTSDCSSPVRLFVGCAFHDGPTGERWSGFAPADAVLPAVVVERNNGTWRLRAAYRPSASFSELAARIERFAAALACSTPADPRPLSVLSSEGNGVDFPDLVRDIASRIQTGEVCKVVAARRLDLTLSRSTTDASIAARLDRSYPGCHRFAFRRGTDTFLGASPERLLRRDGNAVSTVALAGSAPATPAGEEALSQSAKDAHEHAYVVDHIRETLSPFCADLQVADQPRIRRLKHLLHLETPIEGQLKDDTHVLRLVAAMHPTPAVGGAPRERALEWIRDVETADRGWYAGPVGWFDTDGNGELAVAIRSGLVRGDHASLWAGAGIVEQSEPDAEEAETTQKLRPLLNALGVEG